ncbi:RAP [Symbiodinium natans]|uniref:RAP protein n=1 Tax=Symbiodinium natans TaxID=878477 RepID=A0A812IE77_9DINO|nr:RAP [Symbiodinium natans]
MTRGGRTFLFCRRAAVMYKQLNIRDEVLFQTFGARLAEILEVSSGPLRPLQSDRRLGSAAGQDALTRPRKRSSRGEAEGAVMAYLSACGRLNIRPHQAHEFFNHVGPSARARHDVPRLVALAQLAAKFGLADTGEASCILAVVCTAFEGATPSRGYASQAITGQLLLALIFDESACNTRDRALVAAISAVNSSFGCALNSLDEQLAQQLQVTELACRLERPGTMQMLEIRGLSGFLEGVRHLEQSFFGPLPKSSSQQHLQVSGALHELGVQHRTEERLDPYIADVRLTTNQSLIEIDGPLHFVGNSQRYDMKSSLKHRLLTKQGWQVHHIAWNDWPEHHHSRMSYVARLLRKPAPGRHLLEYAPLQSSTSQEYVAPELVE